MVRRWLLAVILGLVLFSAARAEGPARSVDLELVLAVDCSASISNTMLDLQLRGHAAAFRDPATIEAIFSRPGAAVAVTVVSWSSPGELTTLVPWTVVAGPDDALRFAKAIDAASRQGISGTTAVGNAIEKSARQFATAGVKAPRRVIDISSNGFSNVGIAPEAARDAAVAQGITINALVILDEYDWLETYYRDSVIGGSDAFVRVAHGEDDFAAAFRDKLIHEVAWAAPP